MYRVPRKFNEKQLYWLEEINPEYFVELVVLRKGETDWAKEGAILTQQTRQLKDLPAFKHKYADANLFRSWVIFLNAGKTSELGPVPLVLDIDNESTPTNLECAYKITDECLRVLEARNEWAGSRSRLRVVFSGRKGFHIEVRPPAPLDGWLMRNELIDAVCAQLGVGRVGNYLGAESQTVIDTLSHQYVRLVGTLNSWYDDQGRIRCRRVLQMSVDEFRSLGLNGILTKADSV